MTFAALCRHELSVCLAFAKGSVLRKNVSLRNRAVLFMSTGTNSTHGINASGTRDADPARSRMFARKWTQFTATLVDWPLSRKLETPARNCWSRDRGAPQSSNRAIRGLSERIGCDQPISPRLDQPNDFNIFRWLFLQLNTIPQVLISNQTCQ
jgi:hypothetical protein